jgi:gluconolactonase
VYSAPTEVSCQVFAQLPPELEIRDRTSAWAAGRPHQAPAAFLEAPAFDRGANLYCVDIAFGRILRIAPNGEFHVMCQYDGQPNGLAIHSDGRLFVADRTRGVLIFDPATRELQTCLAHVAVGSDTQALKGPNDLVFARNGDLYVTDQGATDLSDPTGRIIRVRAGGAVEIVLEGIPGPNGIAFSPDETLLFVAVTRANAVWRMSIDATGNVGRVSTFIQMSGGAGPDGLAIGVEGHIAVAHPGLGSVWVYDRYGEPQSRIRSCGPGRLTTNIAFGGPDWRTLYIVESASSTVLQASMSTSGCKLFSHH